MTDGGPVEDTDLLARFRQGDAAAFRTLLDRHREALSQRIWQKLPAHLDRKVAVSDILQESMLVAFRRCSELESTALEGFRHWLLTIAENKTREAVRHHVGTAKRSTRREVPRARRAPTRARYSMETASEGYRPENSSVS